MITIRNIRIEQQNNKSRLCADILYKEEENTLWYEVKKEYEKYLCYERADAFLVALLLYAMERQEDIKILDTPVTSKLYFNIINYIIPVLASKGIKYYPINIICNISSEKIFNEEQNGTGISRGVDSFQTLKKYTQDCPKDMQVKWLTFFNVGSHSDFGGENGRKLFLKRKNISEKFAKENNFNFIDVDSNISEFLGQIFVETHSFRSASAVFAIQKLFKNYYYASGYSVHDFKIQLDRPAKFEIYILSFLSTDSLTFYSSGCESNRLNKVYVIKEYELAQKNLNVCFNDEFNCGKCEKCIRTMFELYANNSLEKFSKVFDVEEFNRSKKWYEYMFMKEFYKQNIDYIDTYNLMKEKNLKISNFIKIKAFLYVKIEQILPIFITEAIKNRRKKHVK